MIIIAHRRRARASFPPFLPLPHARCKNQPTVHCRAIASLAQVLCALPMSWAEEQVRVAVRMSGVLLTRRSRTSRRRCPPYSGRSNSHALPPMFQRVIVPLCTRPLRSEASGSQLTLIRCDTNASCSSPPHPPSQAAAAGRDALRLEFTMPEG